MLFRSFSAYLDRLITERAKRPADDRDILGTLIHGVVDGEGLSHDELVQNCIFLLNAGHETTTNLIGNTVDALLRFPEELAQLRADPGLIKSCVEEGLRFESSNQLGNRRLSADLELGGERLVARFDGLQRDGAYERGGRARFRGFNRYPVAWA